VSDVSADSLADIYRTTYRALVRFLYRKVWDAERAEDLAQEAFARAVVHKPDNARGWLFIVAANMARDEARRAARERRHLTLLTAEPREGAPASDEVFLLWDAGLSYSEIAAHTGLAQGAVGTTLARARRRLVEAHEAGEKGEHVARG